MIITAQHKNARMAPRKIRQYRQLLKGLPVAEAEAQLRFLPGEAPSIIRKVLHSAIANAKHNFEIEAGNLKVIDVIIDGGFSLKRFQPVSRGMAHPILKRTSHVTVVIEEVEPKATPTPRRAAYIEELTAADVVTGKVGTHETEMKEAPQPKGKVAKSVPHASKQEEAYTKMKMQQQGGDPKKSHRRKSIGD